MKFLASLVSLSMALAVAAGPVARSDLDKYYLRIVSKEKSLNGQYLSISDRSVGVFPDRDPVLLTVTPSSKDGLFELHTNPVGIIDHALGLVGSGAKDLRDIPNPHRVDDADWNSFSFSGGDNPAEAGEMRLSYAGKAGANSRSGHWVAFPSGGKSGHYKVTWLDGTAITTQDYQLIEVVYEGAMSINV